MDNLSKQIVKTFEAHLAKALAIFKERQAKYGPWNIAAAGYSGVLVRIQDKMARARNSREVFDDESVVDTHYDMCNYALIGLMVYLGEWPKPPVDVEIEMLSQQIVELTARRAKLMNNGSNGNEM